MSTSSSPPRMYKCIPIPKGDHRDTFDYTMLEMVVIHNFVIRGYNSVLYHSGRVEPGTKKFKSFLAYVELLNSILHHHHDIEETVLFPFIESKIGEGTMAVNVAGHTAFETHLKSFEELITSVKASPTLYTADSFRDAVYAAMDPLYEHLTAEIATLRPDRLRGAGLTEADLLEAQERVKEYALKDISITTDAQIIIANGSTFHATWFPPVPKPILFVMKYVVWWVHSDLWAFACCDKHMVVKPEFAAYEPEMEA